MPNGERVFVALGSNVGAREAHLAHARARLAGLPETTLLAVSAIEETVPIGPPQDPYLNQMALLETRLSPGELLARLHDIEGERGRVRSVRWGPRTLDLDIVRFGERLVHEPQLEIPHPELARREFWRREIDQIERGAASHA